MKNHSAEIDVRKYIKQIINSKGLKQKSVAVKAGYTEQQLRKKWRIGSLKTTIRL